MRLVQLLYNTIKKTLNSVTKLKRGRTQSALVSTWLGILCGACTKKEKGANCLVYSC